MQTAAGPFPMNNIIAKFPGKKDGIIVLAGHYDTNLSPAQHQLHRRQRWRLQRRTHAGNRRQLRAHPPQGYSIWLLFTDGEEATVDWTDADSVYGSKQLAKQWSRRRHRRQNQGFPAARHDRRQRSRHRPRHQFHPLAARCCRTAPPSALGSSPTFSCATTPSRTTIFPSRAVGIPVADIIDLDYGFNNIYHHTTAGHTRQMQRRQPADRRRRRSWKPSAPSIPLGIARAGTTCHRSHCSLKC